MLPFDIRHIVVCHVQKKLFTIKNSPVFFWPTLYVIELNTSRELVLLILCISQGSVMTNLRCGGKYDKSLVTNLLLYTTVKEFLKSANIFQSYERISSGTFLWPTVYIISKLYRYGNIHNGTIWQATRIAVAQRQIHTFFYYDL